MHTTTNRVAAVVATLTWIWYRNFHKYRKNTGCRRVFELVQKCRKTGTHTIDGGTHNNQKNFL
jgi:hypothetical protein